MLPSDILQVAKDLAQKNTPASNRSSISRAYYSSFHSGLKFFETYGVQAGSGPEAHRNLEGCFNNASLTSLKSLGVKLGSLKELRTKADYHLAAKGENTEKSATVNDAMDNAKSIVATLNEIRLLPEEIATLRKSIEDWRDRIGNRSIKIS